MQTAALVVTGVPTDDNLSEIAWKMLSEYGSDGANAVGWEIIDSPKDYVNIAIADQLEAHMRDTEGDAFYVVIYIGTDQEIEDL